MRLYQEHIEKLNEYYKKNSHSKKYQTTINALIDLKDPALIYDLIMNVKGVDATYATKVMLECGKVEWFWLLAKDWVKSPVKSTLRGKVDEKSLQAKIVEINDAVYMFRYARDVKSANVQLIAQEMPKDIDLLFSFLTIKNLNQKVKNIIAEKVVKIADADTIIEFAKREPSCAYICLNALINLGEAQPIITFRREIKPTDDDKCFASVIRFGTAKEVLNYCIEFDETAQYTVSAVCKKQDADVIYDLAVSKQFKFSKKLITIMQKQIISLQNAMAMVLFAKDVEYADVKLLEKEVIEIGDAQAIFNFAKFIPDANIPALTRAIIKTKDVEYMLKFMQEIPNADVYKIQLALAEMEASKVLTDLINVPKVSKSLLTECLKRSHKSQKTTQMNTVDEYLDQYLFDNPNDIA